MVKTVLLPIDWSVNAEKAFDWYVYNLHQKGTLMILVHFIDGSPKEIDQKEIQMLELQEVYETRLLQLKIDHRWVTQKGEKGSSPGDNIIHVAKEYQVDLIVMGARGLGKIKKTLLGSVSDHVLRKSKVPVLICKIT